MKLCEFCNEEKDLKEFPSRSCKFPNRCRSCSKKYYDSWDRKRVNIEPYKECKICNKTKPKEEFPLGKGFSDRFICLVCSKRLAKENHESYTKTSKYKENLNRYNREKRERIYAEIKSGPCIDCQIEYPWYVMEFDHVPERGVKLHKISSILLSPKRLEEELKKCDLVCANCHNTREYNRRIINQQ